MIKLMKYLIILLPLLVACQTNRNSDDAAPSVTINYEVVKTNREAYTSLVNLEIINNSSFSLNANEWSIYFSQLGNTTWKDSLERLEIAKVVGEYWRLIPGKQFQSLAPSQSLSVKLNINHWFKNASDLPSGWMISLDDESQPFKINANIEPIAPGIVKGYTDILSFQYDRNEEVNWLDRSIVKSSILPTPKSIQMLTGVFQALSLQLCSESLSSQELDKLDAHITYMSIPNSTEATCNVRVEYDDEISNPEGYELSISSGGVNIKGATYTGVFYALQSLLSIWQNGALPFIEITDEPAFGYRGLHLDVSRNFHSKSSVEKLLKVMSLYKLNKFHFHLTDDEGWRLEIAEIPELTTIGAFRGYTIDESDHLYPAYGSGAQREDPSNYGSGYYTGDDFVDILKLADSLQIEVIPEIDLPGHARAAIKSLEARYNATGDDTYRLIDPNDTSKYVSIQGYPDNVIDVCQESTYRFIEKVVDQLISYYAEANLSLNMIHIGGDEVPEGVWTDSPACMALLENETDLAVHFNNRVARMLAGKNIRMGGWQEIAEIDKGANLDLVPYSWSTVWGGEGVDIGYKLANEGYQVVLSNASNLYFDLAVNWDPAETGQTWAGLVDTRKVFEFCPLDIYKTASNGWNYERLDYDELKKRYTSLTNSGKDNVLGIQGQLWSETIKGASMLEYYNLPKMLALAERVWVGEPTWMDESDEAYKSQWNKFVSQIGYQEFPRLDTVYEGFHYRIPPPGIKVNDGFVQANVLYPGLEIYFRSNTTGPERFSEPVALSSNPVFWTVTQKGRKSREVSLP
jgi:hexosaminidase